jgi:hypothetical protein
MLSLLPFGVTGFATRAFLLTELLFVLLVLAHVIVIFVIILEVIVFIDFEVILPFILVVILSSNER